jgi:putative FmdB family regulatory protein
MPLYAYHCADCDREFEVLESFSDRSTTRDCPGCMQNTAQRKIALSVFRMYGSGVYKPNTRD